jgi:hypothetical protein
VILDTKGNIFGGFTPVEWESRSSFPSHKEDDSLKSFLFTLKNPHNIPPRRFALKAKWKHTAIGCNSRDGPCFYGGIIVSDNCNPSTSNSYIGNYYINDTGLDGGIVCTGSQYFKAREIEVFEITE